MQARELLSDHFANVLLTFIVGNGLLAMALLSDNWKMQTVGSVGAAICAVAFAKASIDAYRMASARVRGWRR
jgi:hypothetical protein